MAGGRGPSVGHFAGHWPAGPFKTWHALLLAPPLQKVRLLFQHNKSQAERSSVSRAQIWRCQNNCADTLAPYSGHVICLQSCCNHSKALLLSATGLLQLDTLVRKLFCPKPLLNDDHQWSVRPRCMSCCAYFSNKSRFNSHFNFGPQSQRHGQVKYESKPL